MSNTEKHLTLPCCSPLRNPPQQGLDLTPSDPPSISSLYSDKKGAWPANGARKHCHFSSIRPQGGTDHNSLPQLLTRRAMA